MFPKPFQVELRKGPDGHQRFLFSRMDGTVIRPEELNDFINGSFRNAMLHFIRKSIKIFVSKLRSKLITNGP